MFNLRKIYQSLRMALIMALSWPTIPIKMTKPKYNNGSHNDLRLLQDAWNSIRKEMRWDCLNNVTTLGHCCIDIPIYKFERPIEISITNSIMTNWFIAPWPIIHLQVVWRGTRDLFCLLPLAQKSSRTYE